MTPDKDSDVKQKSAIPSPADGGQEGAFAEESPCQLPLRRGAPLRRGGLLRVGEVDSTNELAKRYFQNGAPDGMAFIAEYQTKGKGRSGRSWHSPPGAGIYLSVLLKPVIPEAQLPALTLMAGVAAVKAVNEFSPLAAMLKWPNDILLNGRKLGGILCELVSREERWGVVIGIGVNVNHEQDQFPGELRHLATSLSIENGETADRDMLTLSILKRLDLEYQAFLKEGTVPLIKSWTRLTDMFGKPVRLTQGSRVIAGTALRLDEQGRLVIRNQEGQEKAFSSGEVSLKGE